MRKLIVSEFLSVDGVIEAPETWHFPFVNDEVQAEINAGIHATDALLLGRVTYEAFAPFWPSQANNEHGIADHLNKIPKYVVSTTLRSATWSPSTLISANIVAEITHLKQQSGGNIGVTGSATLVQSLMGANLIDEYQIFIHPVVVGHGKKLFNTMDKSTALKLVSSRIFSTGVALMTYQPVSAS
ncbi:MAG: dihydrofolate reductase family protein [Anaerolineae bacterium]